MTSLLRSSDVLCADDLRFHRRLSHTAAPQRIAKRPLQATPTVPAETAYCRAQCTSNAALEVRTHTPHDSQKQITKLKSRTFENRTGDCDPAKSMPARTIKSDGRLRSHLCGVDIEKCAGCACPNADIDTQTVRDFQQRISGFFRDVAAGACAGYPRMTGNTVT